MRIKVRDLLEQGRREIREGGGLTHESFWGQVDEPHPLDVGAYRERIGIAGPVAPSLAGLTAVHEAHVGAVAFENLDILLGRTISLDLGALEAKLVAGRRGGYCFEQNTLFAAELEALGFRVTRLAARVRSGAASVRPRTHMLLVVDLPEGPYLADVGFGGDGPVHPLPLVAGPESWIEDAGYRLHREGEVWVLEGTAGGAWGDLYAFTLEPQYPVDFEMANHFTSTYPRSPFVRSLTVQRSWPGRRYLLHDRELVRREGGRSETLTIAGPDHLLEVLDRDFDLSFPPGTRFSRPQFPDSPAGGG
jgi:N-hydroxyarylamine O-acetyltransferase